MTNLSETKALDHQVFHNKIQQETELIDLVSPSEKTLNMKAASSYKPKKGNPNKPDGEDAHCILSWNQTIVVADGVGGWAKHGVDAGKYAIDIIGNIIVAFVQNPVSNPPIDFPYLSRILDEAYENTRLPGSSTLCLVTLSGRDLLCLNVGDSGFRVIRQGKTVYASIPQVKRFNYPYQLGVKADKPSSAQEIAVRVEIGDVIVVGTDGLFDNVFQKDLENLVNDGKLNKETPDGLAEKISEFARLKSLNKYCPSPFSIEGAKVGEKHKGGKEDDITVVVAYIE